LSILEVVYQGKNFKIGDTFDALSFLKTKMA
jgi:hypothetical protein